MSSRATTGMSRSTQSTSQRRHRSRSTSRYADLEKPKKKKALSATTSLVSIPNTIKLSMLNSGLLSFDKFKLEARDENNSLSQTIPDTPIELRHFVKLCEQRRKFPVLYKLEFQTAIKVETNSCRHATRKTNIEKNQNQKCIPYDYNRVVLEKIDGATDSDYVNASFVDSLLKPNAYIVTQGPTEETVLNFWRTVWQENVSCIVMLTKTFDFTKVMCVQYWPASKDKDEIYGDVYVGVCKEEQLANFHIRTFRMYRRDGDKIIDEREVLQFHYTEWHSHTCPFSNAILEFRRRVRAVVGNIIKANSQRGPMLVHCNDGGGRSGVYLAIDANMELAEEEDCFHVYGYLKRLRQSRKGLIENVDQYKFVYDTLEEHIVCGNSWFPVSQLSERLKQKSIKEPITKMNDYQKEYAQICKQTPRFSIGDCAGGHRGDNREKNRDVLCVPPDNFRPYLTSFQGNAFTDYINSVFVDGYTRPREYIVTEWPLKSTLGEFWSLVYDQECSAVVVLCNPPPASQQYPAFWPESKTPKKYGPVFTVNHRSHHHYSNIRTWLFEINKKIVSLTELMAGVKAPSKTVQLFHLTCWPMGHKVPSSTNSLVALMNMVERWRQKSDYGPVCVVSPDGRSRSGVYCAANACIEQVIEHGEVDIFQAVKTVRRHRPQLVENITEYKYCYDLVLHYVLHYLNKDLKEKKFIEFGRGKSIPLTPENSNSDLPNEMSNAGRVVVKKRIAKIEKGDSFHILDKESSKLLDNRIKLVDKNGKIIERKKKGRLYSLGGNDQPKRNHRGRLDRLKTVGTFDLGTEMCVLSEVARNLNEQIISGEIMQQQQQQLQQQTGNKIIRRLSAIPDVTGNNQGLSGLSTPIGGGAGGGGSSGSGGGSSSGGGIRRDLSKSTSNFSNKSISINNNKLLDTKLNNISVYFDQNKGDLINNNNYNNSNSNNNNKTKRNKSVSVPAVKTQHSADDYKNINELIGKQCGTKPRSLSTGSYLTNSYQKNEKKIILQNRLTSPLNTLINNSTTIELPSPIFDVRKHFQEDAAGTNDSNKIEDDIKSYEDNTKNIGDEIFTKTFANSSRKPLLRKSRRIVRSDSEFLNEETNSKNEIVLYANTDIQIHNEQNIDDINVRHDSVESGCKSRKDSSDLDELCSGKSNFKSTDESSRNISTDELDTVFSDSNDLEQLEKDYREHLKSNLQREYKSDGDTLDEVGRKRNEYGKWKNQSFDNDIDLFPINNKQDDNKLNNIVNVTTGGTIITTGTIKNNNKSLKISDSTNEILIDKSESIISLKEILSNINSPKDNSDNSFNLSNPNQQNRPSDLDISKITSTTKPSSEGSITSLLEKRFGKFKKMNKLLKSKRFSTSILYEKKKSSNILRTEEVLRYTDQTNKNLQHINIDNNNKYSRSSPAKSTISGSKSSIYSSKASLFSSSKCSKGSKGSKGFSFLGRKSSMFSDESHSNSEHNSRTSSGAKLNEISKSNSEISKYKASPLRMSIKRSNKEQKTNSTACLNLDTTKCHSPLSEEFYNKTGSVRLSAMELFEKFCSEDFGGLYKHENFKNEERFDTERSPFLNRYEYIQRMASRGLGAIRKYPAPRNVRLLKQKSEPKFALQNDLLSEDVKEGTMYYHKEEEEDEEEEEEGEEEEYNGHYGQYYNEQDEYYEGEFYEGEDEEEYEDDEECEEEELDGVDDDDLNEQNINNPIEINDDFYKNNDYNDKRKEYFSLEKQTTIIEVLDYNTSGVTKYQLESNLDGTITKNINIDAATSTDSEVDEIYLMPDNSRCDTFFDRDQFTNDRPPLIRVAGIDRSLNNLDGTERGNSLEKFGSDEILTVYRICSKDDILNMTEFSVSDLDLTNYDKTCENNKTINLLDTKLLTKSTPSFMNYEIINSNNEQINVCSLESTVNVNIKNVPTVKNDNNDINIIQPILDPNFIKSDCTIFDRTDSIELLSNSSGTIRSGSTLTDYAFDTVRNMNLDSCSTSKLSLSIKSEVFEEFTLTPDELSKPIKNCDVEDFTLTPEESICEINELINNEIKEYKLHHDIDKELEGQLIVDKSSESQHNVIKMIDKFITNERSSRSIEIDDTIPNLTCKNTNIFNFDHIDINNVEIMDLDDNESVNDEQSISAFTNEITKEFDLLFYRAEEESKTINDELIENNKQNELFNNKIIFERIPTRYSMQKLEPIEINDNIDDDKLITVLQVNVDDEKIINENLTTNNSITKDNTNNEKNSCSHLKTNRSQSLGNLSKKTRCFPL